MNMDEYEEKRIHSLQKQRSALAQLADNVLNAAKLHKKLPLPRKEALKKISSTIAECQQAISRHAEIGNISDQTMKFVSDTLITSWQALDSLVELFHLHVG